LSHPNYGLNDLQVDGCFGQHTKVRLHGRSAKYIL
jgi:hypothetical protein